MIADVLMGHDITGADEGALGKRGGRGLKYVCYIIIWNLIQTKLIDLIDLFLVTPT